MAEDRTDRRDQQRRVVVARALYDDDRRRAVEAGLTPGPEWEHATPADKERYRSSARAAVRALRTWDDFVAANDPATRAEATS